MPARDGRATGDQYVRLKVVLPKEVEPELAEGLLRSVGRAAQDEMNSDRPAILVTSPTLRPWLSRILRPRIPGLSVLSYSELPEDTNLRVTTSITVQARQSAAA